MPCPSNENDLPIALMKGIQLCTKHPLAKYVSHSHLSSSFSAFTTKLSSVDIPKNVQKALIVPEWKKAVLEELNALKKWYLGKGLLAEWTDNSRMQMGFHRQIQ